MFAQWINQLKCLDQTPTPTDTQATESLTALLLVEIARSDQEIDESELAAIRQALESSCTTIDSSQIELIISTARRDADSATSLYDHIRQINEAFNRQQKLKLIEQMWRVAYADGNLDKYEEHTIRKLAALIFVEHREFIKAKLRVQDAMNSQS